MAASQASLLLQKQLKDLCKNPVAGFSAGLVDETNIFEWSVTIIGPPDTLYVYDFVSLHVAMYVVYVFVITLSSEGGFFNAIMSFPSNYPNSPPTVKFTTEIWHPNVYPDGRVCISILHPPGDDPNGYELASERWMPVHTVESIVLSIISMLSGPNDESPANVEAATGILKFSQPSLSFSLHGQVTVTTGNIHVFKSGLWLVLITNVLSFS
ncbi:ubiquitin-conjugating enzyme E2 7 [Citrus sinensis]|uniref:Ubiquitin-conjugating enzyme E2 7 n=1 Tax=Citrus sinensis TaxID=2711 RepID=A0ACB8IVD0_CITSI|nr:ubiquitin-conjugating enzyme E2 7 [Citrus sinensis]